MKYYLHCPPMVSQQLSFRRKKLLTVFTISFLIYTFTSTYSLAQPDFNSDKIILGVRITISPIKNFCYAFEDTLQDTLQESDYPTITVNKKDIKNNYKKRLVFPRYNGLMKDPGDVNHVDIECGPNSRSSGQLDSPNPGKVFDDEIVFSEPFYETGIKLLLKEDLALKLSQSSPEKLEENIRELRIGVLSGTTTWNQLDENRTLYESSFVIKPTKDADSWERTIRTLDSDGKLDDDTNMDALASDGIILQYLLDLGIEGSEEGGRKFEYGDKRDPYRGKNYRIFPSEEFPSPNKEEAYLPRLKPEEYSISRSA